MMLNALLTCDTNIVVELSS